MKKLKRLISVTLAAAVMLSVTALSPIHAEAAQQDFESMSLAEIYKDYFLIGAIFTSNEIPDSQHFEFMKKDYNVLTAENEMKPDSMQRGEGRFSFTSVDAAIEHILDAGMKVVGHTLVWHNQSPPFLNRDVTREEAERNLADHINTVAGHYSGRVMAWDVVNEAVNAGPNPEDWRGNLRKDAPWYQAFAQDGNGEDYIYMAFKLAREAAPDAILYYNDYNMEVSSKAQSVYYMVKEFNERYAAEGNDRLLIEGVGMQGHHSVNVSIADVRESIELFKSLGVEISITELDVGVPGVGPDGLDEETELVQAIVYAQLFSLFKEHSDVIARVTFWGMNDRKSWRSGSFPLLLNADYTPKLAYFAVADPEGFLEEHGILAEQEIFIRLTGNASPGIPVIDGEIDDIWNSAEILPVDQMLQAWQTASGQARVLWDRENLYVLIEVKDSELCMANSNAWERDSVEIFLDEKNCKEGAYNKCDKQFSIRFDGDVATFGANSRVKGFEAKTTVNGSNYIVEVKIPFTEITPESGIIIGLDVQINDARNGERVGIAKWNDPTNESYLDTTGWGEVMLTGEAPPIQEKPEVTETEPEVTETTVTEAKAVTEAAEVVSTSSGSSHDPVLLTLAISLWAVAITALIAFFVTRKKE